MSSDKHELILYPSKVKIALLLTISIAFVAGGVFILDENPVVGWLPMLFFGLCSLVFVFMFIPGSSYLKLTSEGFESNSLFRKHLTRWTDVEYFYATSIGANTMVGIKYSASYDQQSTGRALSKSLGLSEGALPDTYGMKAENLARLMTEWKEQFAS